MRKMKLIALSAALCASLGYASSASAASTQQTGTLGGYSVGAYLSIGSTSASATTTSSNSGGSVYAYVEYKFGLGKNIYTRSNSNSAPGTLVNVAANSDQFGSVSISAAGNHGVYFGSYSWTPTTSVNA